jgi:hypothetical protein
MSKTKENSIAVKTENSVSLSIPEVRSYESVIYVDYTTGEAYPEPKEGTMPVKIPLYNYATGDPIEYQIDLFNANFGRVNDDKETFASVNDLSFTPLSVTELGMVCMYPQKNAEGVIEYNKRNTISIVALLKGSNEIVSFLLPTWSASNFMKEYDKKGRKFSLKMGSAVIDVPVESKLQLVFSCKKKQVENRNKTKVWTVVFEVTAAMPDMKLVEFAKDMLFYSKEHIVEVLSQPANNITQKNAPAWLRALERKLPADTIQEFWDLASDKRLQRTGESIEDTYEVASDYEVAQVLSTPLAAPYVAPEVPSERVAAYLEMYYALCPAMSDEQQDYFLISYNVSLQDFKTKGTELKAFAASLQDDRPY